MATEYRIYKNDGAGGPVDYSTVVTTTASLSYVAAALPLSSDTTFAVRTYDTTSTYDDMNTDAIVRIIVDASGNDVTARPAAPIGITARAIAAGAIRVEWGFPNNSANAAPTSFKVWITSGGSVNYAASPNTTVTYSATRGTYRVDVSGFTTGTTYTVGVRATNAAGDETNTGSFSVVADATAPTAPGNLVATATF